MTADTTAPSISNEEIDALMAATSTDDPLLPEISADTFRRAVMRMQAAEDALEEIDCHATIDMKPEVRAAIDKWREGRKGGRVEGEER